MRFFAPIGKIEKVVHGRVTALKQVYWLSMVLYMYAHHHCWTHKRFTLKKLPIMREGLAQITWLQVKKGSAPREIREGPWIKLFKI